MSQVIELCHYFDNCTDLKAKILKLDILIDALEDAALKAASKQDMDEYWMDDGQTKVKAIYRDAASIAKAIDNFERIRQRYINRINCRVISLKDKHTNIRRR